MALEVKNPPANAKDMRHRFDPWDGEGPLKEGMARQYSMALQPTPVFWPGDSYGQRSLAGYGPQGHKESDTTEAS